MSRGRRLITSGFKSGFLELGMSPTTPLDLKILSPRGIINCDMDRVGLGIVAALEKSSSRKGSDPILVNQTGKVENEVHSFSLKEEHTRPNQSYTNRRCMTKKRIEMRRQGCIFEISLAKFGDDNNLASDFLSSCYSCNKRLHGRDIYMYRGEKAFCSPECRSRQIGMEKRTEKYCSSESSTSSSSSSCNTTRPNVATGIFAI